MASIGRKRRRDEVDDKPNNTVEVTSSDDDDYLSDSAVYHLPSPRELTEEEVTEYYRRSFSSQGFDVPDYGGSLPGGIGPYGIVNQYRKQLVTDSAKRCLQFYNNQKNASFEFDELVKVNSQCVAGLMFYIIFKARSGDNASQTFYGQVWQTLDKTLDVQFCEMYTKQEAGKSEEEAGKSEEEAGTTLEEAGTSLEEAGTSKEEAGTSLEEAGTSLEEAGTSKEEAGTSLEEAGTSLEEAGTSLEEAGTSQA